jgi:hypothetical protein
MSGSEFQIFSSAHSPGIQLADIVLWLMGEPADSFLAGVRSHAERMELTMAYPISGLRGWISLPPHKRFSGEDGSRERNWSTKRRQEESARWKRSPSPQLGCKSENAFLQLGDVLGRIRGKRYSQLVETGSSAADTFLDHKASYESTVERVFSTKETSMLHLVARPRATTKYLVKTWQKAFR